MSISASSIAAKARFLTLDMTGVRWPDEEIVNWLNDAQVTIITHKPTAKTATGAIPLIAGVVQAVPANGVALMQVLYNNVSGTAVTLVDRRDLESSYPAWPGAAQATDSQHYMVDEDDDKTFLVYPPNDGTGSVVARYALLPTPIATVDDSIDLSDEYAPILLEYLMHRIWLKHTNVPNNMVRSRAHQEEFLRMLGVKVQTSYNYSPKRDAEEGRGPV